MSELFGFSNDRLWVHHKRDEISCQSTLYMHAHDMLEIYYLISGNVEFSVEGNCYEPKPGDIMIVRWGETHKIHVSPGMPYERITVHLVPDYLDKFGSEYEKLQAPFLRRELGQQNQYRQCDFESVHWHSCLLAMVKNPRESLPDVIGIEANLLVFLTELYTAYKHREQNVWGEETKSADALSAELINYINHHLFAPLSVASVSRQFHISEAHMNRIFRKATGSSMWKYIRVKRLIAARNKICKGVPAQNAAITCGFGDYSAFFRAYKATFGTTPQEDHRKATRI
ncbi:MAG: helix-turn-helix domain-containing protein [Eubacteriales bacterium]